MHSTAWARICRLHNQLMNRLTSGNTRKVGTSPPGLGLVNDGGRSQKMMAVLERKLASNPGPPAAEPGAQHDRAEKQRTGSGRKYPPQLARGHRARGHE